jgi:ATP-dependent Clp protease ATP-binding subunit ClpA
VVAAIKNYPQSYCSSPTVSKKIVDTIRPSWFSWSVDGGLKREIESLSPGELKRVLDEVMLEEGGMAAIDRLAELISLEKLQEAVQTAYSDPVDALKKAQSMLAQAKYFFEQSEDNFSPTLKTRITAVLISILNVIESILNAFGIANLFRPAENAIEADWKGQKIMTLLSLFTMLSTVLVPVLGAESVGLVIGGILLTISALSLIFPYIKPRPALLPLAENWSEQSRKGQLSAAQGRKGTLDAIANALRSKTGVKTHPMLIGKTGIGKTETVRAFVQAVERGDYPDLAGIDFHYINSEGFVSHSDMFRDGNSLLPRYSELMGRHRNRMGLIFDEAHMLCRKKEKSAMCEQLKTYLDPKGDNFPHVIFLTTEEEYYREIYANNPAFARRLKRI